MTLRSLQVIKEKNFWQNNLRKIKLKKQLPTTKSIQNYKQSYVKCCEVEDREITPDIEIVSG